MEIWGLLLILTSSLLACALDDTTVPGPIASVARPCLVPVIYQLLAFQILCPHQLATTVPRLDIMLKDFEVRVPSFWINVLNFIIFDVVLISLVFYLTGDVMGRLNDSTLRDGEPHRIFIVSPPLVGGGLCTTNPFRAFVLLSARVLGLVLIFMTNSTISGQIRAEVFQAEDTVLTHGNLSRVDLTSFVEAVELRSGCQWIASPDEGSNIIYGELRGDNWSTYVTDRKLLTGTVVEFGTLIVWRNLSTGGPCESGRRVSNYESSLISATAAYFCPKATLMCSFEGNESMPNLYSCRGLVEHENETYMGENGGLWPEMGIEPTPVRLVRGVDFRSREWLDAIFIIPNADMMDAIDAMYAARAERRMVLRTRDVPWTLISPLWLVVFTIKVGLVGVLVLVSVALRRANLRTVAHDEHALTEILRTRLVENKAYMDLNERMNIHLNATVGKSGLEVYADAYPQQTTTIPAREAADRKTSKGMVEYF